MAEKKSSLSARRFHKALQRSKILDLVRTSGLISRTELARRTGLSQASVTGITADLIQEGLVEEKQSGPYEGGRRPILLAIRPDGVHVVGVNISMEQIRVALVNFQAEITASHSCVLGREYYDPNEIVEKTAQAIQACIWDANFAKEQISGVGVGIPGPVDSAAGIVRFLPNYGWQAVPFRDLLCERINHPVFIDNSSNNYAIAEYWYGIGKGIDNFLVVTLENGVGAGMVLNGQLIRGYRGIASEFGHLSADLEGPLCRCGRKGCIEAFAGNNAIIRESRKLAGKGLWSSPGIDPEQIGYREVLAELEYGNKSLEALFAKAGEVLGWGLYNLIALLNPELVVITGKGVQAGKSLFDGMYSMLERLDCGTTRSAMTKIVIRERSDDDWVRGSGTLVLREIYKSPAVI